MKYQLTISPDYVAHWGLWEAVRELLQNAIDQRVKDRNCEVVFEYDEEKQVLSVGNTNGTPLTPATLLLGASSKRGDSSTIGQFGEGYKLALLVLTRLGYSAHVWTGDEVWTPSLEHSEEFGTRTLNITTRFSPFNRPGTLFKIHGVSRSAFDVVDRNYLPSAARNEVVAGRPGDVFVEGLFVCHNRNLKHGYNFSANRLTLDRDRGIVTDFDLAYETSKRWGQSHHEVSAYFNLLKADAMDVRYSNPTPQVAAQVLAQFRAEHGDALPVSTQEDVERAQGHKFVLVPDILKRILFTVGKFILRRKGSPKEQLQSWMKDHEHKLDGIAKQELEHIIEGMN